VGVAWEITSPPGTPISMVWRATWPVGALCPRSAMAATIAIAAIPAVARATIGHRPTRRRRSGRSAAGAGAVVPGRVAGRDVALGGAAESAASRSAVRRLATLCSCFPRFPTPSVKHCACRDTKRHGDAGSLGREPQRRASCFGTDHGAHDARTVSVVLRVVSRIDSGVDG
jgi:hypothetical protein